MDKNTNDVIATNDQATHAAGDRGGRTNGGAAPVGGMDRFRLSQNFAAAAQVKKSLTTVPVRKPHNQEFIRTSETFVFETNTFTAKDDGRIYLVDPSLFADFPVPLRPTQLVGAINRQGVFFFWPIFLPVGDEPWNPWHRSASDKMVEARATWVRVASNRALGAYEGYQAPPGLSEPVWPDLDLNELLQIAFRDYIIATPDHPVLRMLNGNV